MLKILSKKKFKINLSWLLFDKLFRASANIFLTIFLARNLGPDNFGILNYLLAILFLFISISSLGVNPVLINKIVKNKKNNINSLINAYYLRFITSIICYLIFLLIINHLNKNIIYLNYSLIIGLIIILKSCEVLFSYFEAKSLLKYIVISQSFGFFISALVILYSVINGLDNIYIYYALVLDLIIVFILINIFYFFNFNDQFYNFDFFIIKDLILKSLPVLISSLSIILYMRIDQIMIKEMLNEYQLGIYSVSVRYIEIFHFIPKIIIISILPMLLVSKEYNLKLYNLNKLINKFSFVIIFLIFISTDFLIPIIFSDIYTESIMVTKILSLSLFFVYLGVINEHWYVSKNLQKFYAINVSLGALLNIVLNYLFISHFGLNGAAYATLLTYVFIIFLFDSLNKETRLLLKIKLNSIFKI